MVAARQPALTSDGSPWGAVRALRRRWARRGRQSLLAPVRLSAGAPRAPEPSGTDYPDDTAVGGQVSTTFVGNGGPLRVASWTSSCTRSFPIHGPVLLLADERGPADLYNRDPLSSVRAKVAPYSDASWSAYPVVVDMDGDPRPPAPRGSSTRTRPRTTTRTRSTSTLECHRGICSTEVGRVRPGQQDQLHALVKAIVDAYDAAPVLG